VDSANSLAMLLRLLGHEVRTAHDGPHALAEAEAYRPEVAVLDIGLPGLNGYEVARALRARPDLSPAVLVALSGYGGPEDRRRSRQAGFDAHLVKPVEVEVLQKLLARADAGAVK
jgi:CheY-like chemotaxis protein